MADNRRDTLLYPYDPVKAAPIVFAILLAGLGAVHYYQSFIKYRWRHFGSMMVWASLVWVAGFVCRAISIYYQQNVGLYIAQFVLIIMGPPFYAVAEYFILGRLLAYVPYHAPIHPGRVLSTFLFLSMLVEVLTANGAANSSGTSEAGKRAAGLACLQGALILQACIEALFFSMVVVVELRCRRAKRFPRQIRTVCYTLYITSFMMLVRCIARTIEGFEAASCSPDDPECGWVSQREWYLWLFEIANITVFVIILAIYHPGHYLPRTTRIFLDPNDGRTERLGPGFSKADKRSLLVTCVDPFNLVGIVTGKGMTPDKFWEDQHPILEDVELSEQKR